MRVTLVHNAGAGEGDISKKELKAALESAGHHVTYVPHEASGGTDWLDDLGEVVVAAGGDGTVARVARKIAGRGAALAILPTGTANNIARSFGVPCDLDALLGALADGGRYARVAQWGLGVARGPWGEKRFVEAAGVGIFARLLRAVENVPEELAHADPGRAESRRDELQRARRRLLHVVEGMPVRSLALQADGEDLADDYLMAEALNVRYAGPAIDVAPGTPREDGRLTLVTLRAAERETFAHFLRGVLRGDAPSCPIASRPVRTLSIPWPPDAGRLDDQPWPKERAEDDAVVEVRGGGERLRVVVPG